MQIYVGRGLTVIYYEQCYLKDFTVYQ